MSQLPLFGSDISEPARRDPDLAYIRKSLNRTLRTARDAEILPWIESEAVVLERRFPELAAMLPAEEAKHFVAEFEQELARLRSVI